MIEKKLSDHARIELDKKGHVLYKRGSIDQLHMLFTDKELRELRLVLNNYYGESQDE